MLFGHFCPNIEFYLLLFFLLHQNCTKLAKGFATCYVNTQKNHGHDLKRLNGPEKNSHICVDPSQKRAHWKLMGDEFHLVDMFGTAA